MTAPETSIILRTFNEERHLPRLFAALDRQRYRDFEVVNVDSGSYDRTTEIVRRHGARTLAVSPRDFTFGYSLNQGVGAAAGGLVVVVSAHTEPIDDLWLGKLVAPLRGERVAMAYGRQYGTATSKLGEVRDLSRTFGSRRKVLEPPKFFANNANSAFLRELWVDHPFDEDLPGQEDIEWAKHWMERGYQVVYEPEAGIYHIHHETWRQVRRRYYREAVASRAIGLWGPKHAVGLAAREAAYLVGDSVAALRQGELISRAREILSFRAVKAFGTVSGLLDGKTMSTPSGREELLFDRTCKAVVIRGANQASLEQIDVPAIRPGDVLVHVAYAGVTSVDLGLLAGDPSFHGGAVPPYPLVPGRELSGWVARAGSNARHLRQGDPVVVQSLRGCGTCRACLASRPLECDDESHRDRRTGTGAYSEYVSVSGAFVHKLPEDIDMRKAVLVEPLAVVVRGLRRVERLFRGSGGAARFAVVGAGPIGHLCALMLSSREMQVTVFDRNPKRLAYFEGTPVSTSFDTGELDRFDVVVEATGDPDSLEEAVRASKSDAVHLLLGLPSARRQFAIRGSDAGEKTIVWSGGASADDFQQAARMISRLAADALAEYVVPLPDFQVAWSSFRQGAYLKVLIDVSANRDLTNGEVRPG